MSIQEFHLQLTQVHPPNELIATLRQLALADDSTVAENLDDAVMVIWGGAGPAGW